MTTPLCLKEEIILLQYLKTLHLALKSFLFLLQAKTLVLMLRLPISLGQGMRRGSSGLTQKQVCKVVLICNAKWKHKTMWMLWGKLLGQNISNNRLRVCQCRISYPVKNQFQVGGWCKLKSHSAAPAQVENTFLHYCVCWSQCTCDNPLAKLCNLHHYKHLQYLPSYQLSTASIASTLASIRQCYQDQITWLLFMQVRWLKLLLICVF